MMTHKFLAKGAIGPLSRFAWPVPRTGAPGAWVEAVGPLGLCARGIHVCRAFELAHWIHDELWEVEAEGDQIEGLDCIVVQRARLVRPIDEWSGVGGQRFADACVAHAAAQAGPTPADSVSGLLSDARLMSTNRYVGLAAYTAAIAVSRFGAEEVSAGTYRLERAWQSTWIARELLASRHSGA